jgi:hypothetical protein
LTYRFEDTAGWEEKRDEFITRVREKDFEPPLAHSPFEAIFEVPARKSFVDASERLTAAYMDMAVAKLFAEKRS